jgi:hypothetical protein
MGVQALCVWHPVLVPPVLAALLCQIAAPLGMVPLSELAARCRWHYTRSTLVYGSTLTWWAFSERFLMVCAAADLVAQPVSTAQVLRRLRISNRLDHAWTTRRPSITVCFSLFHRGWF